MQLFAIFLQTNKKNKKKNKKSITKITEDGPYFRKDWYCIYSVSRFTLTPFTLL